MKSRTKCACTLKRPQIPYCYETRDITAARQRLDDASAFKWDSYQVHRPNLAHVISVLWLISLNAQILKAGHITNMQRTSSEKHPSGNLKDNCLLLRALFHALGWLFLTYYSYRESDEYIPTDITDWEDWHKGKRHKMSDTNPKSPLLDQSKRFEIVAILSKGT